MTTPPRPATSWWSPAGDRCAVGGKPTEGQVLDLFASVERMDRAGERCVYAWLAVLVSRCCLSTSLPLRGRAGVGTARGERSCPAYHSVRAVPALSTGTAAAPLPGLGPNVKNRRC